ncbi:MAG: bifunctional UDP-N-acetylglucosamine diphosphorylase/glucosamine-1-phosphate N-acetyltransferase GlmU [Pseudomonadota bacterium]
MTFPKSAAIVLAAGLGTRMKSARPKVMHALAGRPLIGHVVAALVPLRPARVAVVVGKGMDEVAAAAHRAGDGIDIAAVVQRAAKGTGHAVRQAQAAIAGAAEDVLILYGDAPLIATKTLRRLLAARRGSKCAIVVAGMRPANPGPYGRLVTGPRGSLERIVEAVDLGPDERARALCHSGLMAVDGKVLFGLVGSLKADNAKGEYYLTDLVGLARSAGLACGYIEADADELVGVNSRAELAAAEAIMQGRLRQAAMKGGATLVDPASVRLSFDTRLGRDVTVGPWVVFGPGVAVAEGTEILAFCHLEGARVGRLARIGPFARLRPGAAIGEGAHVGNFVEIKNATVEAGAKINHLAYVGDARVGRQANVGAGTITCNYDGFVKAFTDIGAGAFIGSNSALVAPVKIGKGAIVAAGSVITRDVAPHALALARGVQTDKRNWAKKFRAGRREKGRAAKAPVD